MVNDKYTLKMYTTVKRWVIVLAKGLCVLFSCKYPIEYKKKGEKWIQFCSAWACLVSKWGPKEQDYIKMIFWWFCCKAKPID